MNFINIIHTVFTKVCGATSSLTLKTSTFKTVTQPITERKFVETVSSRSNTNILHNLARKMINLEIILAVFSPNLYRDIAVFHFAKIGMTGAETETNEFNGCMQNVKDAYA